MTDDAPAARSDRDPSRYGYREIAERYGLAPILRGVDFIFGPDGDFKMSKDNGIQLGDRVQSALGRLVVRWRFNAPTLKILLDIVIDAKRKKTAAEALSESLTTMWREDREAAIELWHTANDEIGVHEFGPEACAGAIMVVLQNLLRREWSDLDESAWLRAGERLGGHALGPIIEAAANNFRHSDEWAATHPHTSQQPGSINILNDVLRDHAVTSHAPFHIRGNVCPEVLTVLINGSIEKLMEGFFGCARSLAGI